jgi:hypothetical protein
VALAQRTDVAGVREWSNNCRVWVERNRTRLLGAIAAGVHKGTSILTMPGQD